MNAETPTDPLDAAEQHAELRVPRSGAALPKRLVERLSLFLLAPQRAYNRGVIDAIRMLRAEGDRIGQRMTLLEQHLTGEGAAITRLAEDVRSELRELRAEVSDALTEEVLTRGQILDIAQTLQRMEQRVAQLDATLAGERAGD